jgi:hypothetical protein
MSPDIGKVLPGQHHPIESPRLSPERAFSTTPSGGSPGCFTSFWWTESGEVCDPNRVGSPDLMDASPLSDHPAVRHREAAARHEEAALRHEDAGRYWLAKGDEELAELERRCAGVEREAAEIERDRAALLEGRERAAAS